MYKQTLNKIKLVLIQDKCKDNDCISVYDILAVIKRTCTNYKIVEDNFERYIKENLGDSYSWVISANRSKYFNFETMHLFIERIGDTIDYATFKKVDGDLLIHYETHHLAQDILSHKKQRITISNFFDYFAQYKCLFAQNSNNIKSTNSDFIIDISEGKIVVSLKSKEDKYIFRLSLDMLHDVSNYKCNSSNVINLFDEKELEILKRIFVKIEDCPKWTQSILYETRQNQLAKELKQEKRRQLVRSIFQLRK